MEAPAFTVDNIKKAIHQLYHDPNIGTKDVAQRWLMIAQHSKLAWNFSWELLQENEPEVQYFGASALVVKISTSWNEIPEDEIFSLRNCLYNEIFRLSGQPTKRIILTRVCVAFAAFVIQCSVHQKWDNAVTEIIARMQDESSNSTPALERCLALLEILTVLPEEYQTKSLEKYWKGLVKIALVKGTGGVFTLLNQLIDTESIRQTHGRVVKCFSSWVALGVEITEYSDLLHKVFGRINNEQLFDNCVDCLLNAFSTPNIHQYPTTIKTFIPKVLELRPMLHHAIENHDTDICLGITKIVTGLAENQTKLLIDNIADQTIGVPVILLVMECTAIKLQYPTEEVSSPITLSFWYTLQDELTNCNETMYQLQKQIAPLYYQLIEVLLRKGRYPDYEEWNGWTSDEKEQHRIYRIDISDTLMYIMEMLGSGIIAFMFHKLTETIAASSNNTSESWKDIEAYLFGLHSVIESLADWDAEVACLNNLALLLPTIRMNNAILADTILYTIGSLTEWLAFYPAHIGNLLPIVLECLNTSDLILPSVLTLKRMTRECGHDMQNYATIILSTVKDLLTKGVLKSSESVWLMQSAGHVLSHIPSKDCIQQLHSVLVLHMHQLKALAEEQACPPNKNSILNILEILSSLFTTLDRRKPDDVPQEQDEQQPVLLILQEINPTIEQILNIWISDCDVVSAVCGIYDRSIRNLLGHFSPAVHSLCDMLAKIYQTAPQTSVLELTNQLTLVFGNDELHKPVLALLIRAIIRTSQQVFDGGNIREHPDIAHGFLRLLSQVIRKHFNLLLELQNTMASGQAIQTVDFNLLFHCGLITLSLLDSESVKTSTAFFIDLCNLYSSNSDVGVVVNQRGRTLLVELLKTVGGAAPRTVMDNVSDVFFAIMKCNFQQFSNWFPEIIRMNEICTAADETRKETFIKCILKEQKSRKRIRDLVKEFSLVCRGLHGTEYAAG